DGSFPGLRTGTNAAPRCCATGAPRMNPRLSMPITCVIASPANGAAIASVARWNSAASSKIGVMSLKTIPDMGKSGTSRMARRSWAASGPEPADELIRPSPPDLEWARQFFAPAQRIAGDVGNRRVARPARHGRGELLHPVVVATHRDLHTAIGTVADPPIHPQSSRGLASEPPEPDPLHRTPHAQVQPQHITHARSTTHAGARQA